jgi:hypothetical protein
MQEVKTQEIEVDFYASPESGLFITDIETEELFYLKCDKSDIEDWVLRNGSEGTDFTYEKEWQDNYPDKGYYESVKVLIEDAWDSQVKDYAFAFRSEWENRTEH